MATSHPWHFNTTDVLYSCFCTIYLSMFYTLKKQDYFHSPRIDFPFLGNIISPTEHTCLNSTPALLLPSLQNNSWVQGQVADLHVAKSTVSSQFPFYRTSHQPIWHSPSLPPPWHSLFRGLWHTPFSSLFSCSLVAPSQVLTGFSFCLPLNDGGSQGSTLDPLFSLYSFPWWSRQIPWLSIKPSANDSLPSLVAWGFLWEQRSDDVPPSLGTLPWPPSCLEKTQHPNHHLLGPPFCPHPPHPPLPLLPSAAATLASLLSLTHQSCYCRMAFAPTAPCSWNALLPRVLEAPSLPSCQPLPRCALLWGLHLVHRFEATPSHPALLSSLPCSTFHSTSFTYFLVGCLFACLDKTGTRGQRLLSVLFPDVSQVSRTMLGTC